MALTNALIQIKEQLEEKNIIIIDANSFLDDDMLEKTLIRLFMVIYNKKRKKLNFQSWYNKWMNKTYSNKIDWKFLLTQRWATKRKPYPQIWYSLFPTPLKLNSTNYLIWTVIVMIVRKKKAEIIKSPNKTCDQLITMSYISILILVMNHYLKPLYITINVNDVLVYKVLVNNVVTLNIMSLTLINKIGCNRVDMIPSKMLMSDFVKDDDQEFET